MSAQRLRAAASVLRVRAEAATPGPWKARVRVDGHARVLLAGGQLDDDLAMHGYPADATYIATMHPGVGLALADWLLWTSVLAENDGTLAAPARVLGRVTLEKALTLADLILGGAS